MIVQLAAAAACTDAVAFAPLATGDETYVNSTVMADGAGGRRRGVDASGGIGRAGQGGRLLRGRIAGRGGSSGAGTRTLHEADLVALKFLQELAKHRQEVLLVAAHCGGAPRHRLKDTAFLRRHCCAKVAVQTDVIRPRTLRGQQINTCVPHELATWAKRITRRLNQSSSASPQVDGAPAF